jgi:hypothetical protein
MLAFLIKKTGYRVRSSQPCGVRALWHEGKLMSIIFIAALYKQRKCGCVEASKAALG